MLPIQRKKEIMRLIRLKKSVKVNELSELFEVTEETIRRDLDRLNSEGLLKKTYGGAVLEDLVSEDIPLSDRLKVNMAQKKLIGKIAGQLIEDGETVFIDMSTTALEVVKSVDASKKITVITNALNALKELNHYRNITLIGIGGALNGITHSMEGPMAVKFIDCYYTDKAFISVKAVSMERGITDSKENAAEIKRHMIDHTKQTILVVDRSKFDHSALIKVADFKEVDAIVTEDGLSEDWMTYLEQNEVDVILAK